MKIPQSSKESYVDLKRRFSYKSSPGNQYLFVKLDYNGNYIDIYSLKTRQSITI